MERNEGLRELFTSIIGNHQKSNLYYIDECGIDEYIYREYAYSPRGVPVTGKVKGRKYKRMNIVAAKCEGRIIAPMVYDGTTDSKLFETWFTEMLLTSVPKGSVLIMDNATFHRKSKLRELADASGCEVVFLPPYSPDLNPIERFWAWLKAKLRRYLSEFDSFFDAITYCFQVM